MTNLAFERSSKRRKGFPSETRVKRGDRKVRGRCRADRKARPQWPLPMRLSEVISSAAAWRAETTTAPSGTTISARI